MPENFGMAKKEKILILAGSGTGKTTAAALYKNVTDIDTINYMFKYSKKHYGKLSSEDFKNLINGWLTSPADYPKGSIKQKKLLGPLKLFFAINKAMKNNIVLVPLIPDTFKGMKSVFKKHRKILVFPEKEIFEEYANRFRARGNDENFIKVREADHNAVWELLEAEHGFETIVLKQGEFLTDALKKMNTVLIEA